MLVAAAIFQLVDRAGRTPPQWYPWSFSFRATHYAVAWVAIGALLCTSRSSCRSIRAALSPARRRRRDGAGPADSTRRGLLRTALRRLGGRRARRRRRTVPWLRKVSVFAARVRRRPAGRPGQQDAPAPPGSPRRRSTRRTASSSCTAARRSALLRSPTSRRCRSAPRRCRSPASRAGAPRRDWTGVRLRDLLDLVGAPAGTDVTVESLQPRGAFRVTEVRGNLADDPLTLLALQLNGEPLSIDHGYPCRLIAPNRPGVLQTKWVSRIEVPT